MHFFVNRDGQTNSLLENDRFNREALGGLTDHLERVEVQTIALDDWVPQHVAQGPLIVKADIQGAEGLMIEGGRQTFRDRVVALHCEVLFAPLYQGQTDFRRLYDLLTELGFEIFDIYPCGRDGSGRAGWADVMWVKPDQVLPL
jgi:hypothetical protein